MHERKEIIYSKFSDAWLKNVELQTIAGQCCASGERNAWRMHLASSHTNEMALATRYYFHILCNFYFYFSLFLIHFCFLNRSFSVKICIFQTFRCAFHDAIETPFSRSAERKNVTMKSLLYFTRNWNLMRCKFKFYLYLSPIHTSLRT